MKHVNNFNLFLFENYVEMEEIFGDLDVLESIVTNSDELLKSINAEEVDFFQTFSINSDQYTNNIEIETIYEDEDFNSKLKKMGLKKNEIEYSEETETFLKDTILIKFFSIHKKDTSELDKPDYIIFQSRKRKDSKWDNIKCYIVNEDMRNFYDKLTNKTIEIKKGDKNYIYITSNSGNDWQLQKHDHNQDTNTFKDMMSNDEIKAILTSDDVSITILT
ncbi:hypothetical protein M0Q50_01145 [bacterium]|jgi:hypothetical protein|nr:hypothetical protein [bacterium]